MKNMVQTELRFVRLLKEIDEAQEALCDLGGEENEMIDNSEPFGPAYTEQEELRLDEIEFESNIHEVDLRLIRAEMGLTEKQFDIMRNSCITNRWEIYAHLMGADIVSLKDIANGKA